MADFLNPSRSHNHFGPKKIPRKSIEKNQERHSGRRHPLNPILSHNYFGPKKSQEIPQNFKKDTMVDATLSLIL